jgi:hypothetical protein
MIRIAKYVAERGLGVAQIARVFWWRGSRVVRLPPEFWFEGDELRIERRGASIVLWPDAATLDRGPCDRPVPPPPEVTFAGFLGPTPAVRRPNVEVEAEIRRLFPSAPANDNEPPGLAGRPKP